MTSESDSSIPDEVFRSRLDAWLVVLVVGIQVVGLWLAMTSPSTQAGLGKGAGVTIMVLSTALLLVLFWWLYRSTAYTLTDDSLFVRCGPLNWHIAYRDITSVSWTNNPISSAALSLRRLKISYGKWAFVMISPPDRDAFIAALRRRVPGLVVKE